MISHKTICMLVLVAATAPSLANAQAVWQGRVIDGRTGQAIRGITLAAGSVGRVDAFEGYKAVTGPDGRFSITCPKAWCEVMNKAREPYFLRVYSDPTPGYVNAVIIRPAPKQGLTIKLVPNTVFIKGQAVSAETGARLPGIGVALRLPGSIELSVDTDGQGNFAFGPVAAFMSMNDPVVDAAPPALGQGVKANPLIYRPWMVCQYGKGGDRFQDVLPPVRDGRFVPPLNLVSSRSDATYTYVILKLPKRGTAVVDSARYTSSQVKGGPTPDPAGSPDTPGDANLALRHAARQSSRSEWSTANDPQGGVDGVKNGRFGFHTGREASPWWQVDLGAPHVLREVRVYNRLDAASDRARTLRILLSSDGTRWEQVYRHAGAAFGGTDGKFLRVQLGGRTARHVRVQLAETNFLHLDEVEVWGR